MSKDCKDTLQTLKTVTKRECDTKWEQSICQIRLYLHTIVETAAAVTRSVVDVEDIVTDFCDFCLKTTRTLQWV